MAPIISLGTSPTSDFMKRLLRVAGALVALIAMGPEAQAVFSYETVPVGNLNNASDGVTGYGSVPYEYRIGKYEVTIGQYVNFLNAVAQTDTYSLYSTSMETDPNIAGIRRNGSPGSYAYSPIPPVGLTPTGTTVSAENRPVSYVSWFSAARFANWMSNGQGSGSTETGAYTLGGQTSGTAPILNAGAQFYLPTENEWYKAAYYSPTLNSGSGGYYKYATQSDAVPGNRAGSQPNQANYRNGIYSVPQDPTNPAGRSQNYLTDVGSFTGSGSFYGTFDQSGNVAEWVHVAESSQEIIRGGSWKDTYSKLMSSSSVFADSSLQGGQYGFRLASLKADNPGGPDPHGGGPGPRSITINVASGTQTQIQADYQTLSGATPVEKTGVGTLIVDQANPLTGTTTVQQGTLQLAHVAALSSSRIVPLAGGAVSLAPYLETTAGGLAPNAGGLVNLGSGKMTVVSGLSPADLATAIVAGRADGSWTGTSGITSSVAASDVAASVPRAVGWLDNGDGSVTASFAALGDSNIDWQVDVLDAGNFLSFSRFDTGLMATWLEGDFNYDRVVDILDASDFFSTGLYDAGNYNTPSRMVSGGVAAVPEPKSTVAALLTAACGLLVAQRNRRHVL